MLVLIVLPCVVARFSSLRSGVRARSRLVASGRLEELFKLRPISSDHVVRADVPTTLECLEPRTRDLGKLLGSGIGYARIIRCVEH